MDESEVTQELWGSLLSKATTAALRKPRQPAEADDLAMAALEKIFRQQAKGDITIIYEADQAVYLVRTKSGGEMPLDGYLRSTINNLNTDRLRKISQKNQNGEWEMREKTFSDVGPPGEQPEFSDDSPLPFSNQGGLNRDSWKIFKSLDDNPLPEDKVITNEELSYYQQLLAGIKKFLRVLPSQEKIVFETYLELILKRRDTNYTRTGLNKEVAIITGVEANQVAQILFKVRRKLKSWLRKEGYIQHEMPTVWEEVIEASQKKGGKRSEHNG